MITADQTETIEFLSSPSTHGGANVERIETHASVVFLAGTHAWKLKRAVRYDYLDFSDVQRRKTFCQAEVRINQRTAPTLYHGAVAVTRKRDGALELGGSGAAVDWVIEMTRFDQDNLFDSFLLMDLWRRHLPRHANVVWNGYLAETMDLEGVSLLPLFLFVSSGGSSEDQCCRIGASG